MARLAGIQGLVEVFQLRRQEIPVVQNLLHALRNARRIMRGAEVAGHHDQLTIARTVFVAC